MFTVGLTGGIGSGKTTIARFFLEQYRSDKCRRNRQKGRGAGNSRSVENTRTVW